ncbi:hypothetical protein DK26_08500 [Bosea sp. WAO]|nr:hypothetical protein DK26_08500 [Bosea sp. WAO]
MAALMTTMASAAQAAEIVVAAGSERRIARAGSVNSRTCLSSGKEPLVVRPPAHGRLAIRMEEARIGNRNSRCFGQVARAFAVYYRPNPGYRGQDSVTLSDLVNNGRVDVRNDRTFRLSVR